MKRISPLQRTLQAALGLLVVVLQVVGALHFTLVRHGFSAALGGVVHVHAVARTDQKPPAKVVEERATTLVSETPSCAAELCPDGDVSKSSAPEIELLPTGWVAFGDVRALSERAANTSPSRQLFLSAPKTSPPV